MTAAATTGPNSDPRPLHQSPQRAANRTAALRAHIANNKVSPSARDFSTHRNNATRPLCIDSTSVNIPDDVSTRSAKRRFATRGIKEEQTKKARPDFPERAN